MAIQNQGFRKDLNLSETEVDALALNVLGGAGISDDIAIIQNNLRNISTISYNSLSSGFFYFGEDNAFAFTNDDIVTVSKNINVGSTTLIANQDYYVCNSDTKTKFKLSTTPSRVGVNTISVTSVSPTDFNFIRRDYVTRENISNFVRPDIDDDDFSFFQGLSVKDAIESTQIRHDTARYDISSKYSGISDLSTRRQILIEGDVAINDPTRFNISQTRLTDTKSPGIFINGVRAFSSNNNPWQRVGTALSTSSEQVGIGELFFNSEINITGISTQSGSSVSVSSFSHKIPVNVNGETYYLLLTA